jgi:hypothetical protein
MNFKSEIDLEEIVLRHLNLYWIYKYVEDERFNHIFKKNGKYLPEIKNTYLQRYFLSKEVRKRESKRMKSYNIKKYIY